MATYIYTCTICGAELDIRSPMDKRNEPKQEAHPDKRDPEKTCEGVLERGDNLETTAFTPYGWKV